MLTQGTAAGVLQSAAGSTKDGEGTFYSTKERAHLPAEKIHPTEFPFSVSVGRGSSPTCECIVHRQEIRIIWDDVR